MRSEEMRGYAAVFFESRSVFVGIRSTVCNALGATQTTSVFIGLWSTVFATPSQVEPLSRRACSSASGPPSLPRPSQLERLFYMCVRLYKLPPPAVLSQAGEGSEEQRVLLKELRKMREVAWFEEPVTDDMAPGYSKCITSPMCLTWIEAKFSPESRFLLPFLIHRLCKLLYNSIKTQSGGLQ